MKYLLSILLATCLALSAATAGTMGIDTTTATTSGSVRSGARQVILVFSTNFAGTVNGATFTPFAGGTMNFGPFDNNTTDTITYTISAGTLYIIRVQ